MRRFAAIAVTIGLIIGGAIIAPVASAGTAPTPTRGQPVIAMSDRTTCAIRESHRVYCWGSNSSGELGRGNTSPTTAVAPVSAVLSDAIGVYGSATFAGEEGGFCALKVDRTVACWGESESYRLGNGAIVDLLDPTPIPGLTNVASMGMGESASCAVKQDGTVWCVGASSLIVPPSGSASYVKIPGISNAVSVGVGISFACALKIDKTVWCWGTNGNGQLGNGLNDAPSGPVKVTGLVDATALAVGGDHSCALRAGGTVVCWGYNGASQLGHVPAPAAGFSRTPLSVTNVSGAKSISAAPYASCVTTATLVKCWGYGNNYVLGDSQNFAQPAAVIATASLDSPTMTATGAGASCEVASGNRVYCWGANLAGEAGIGSTTPVPDGGGPWNAFGYALTPRAVPITNSAPGKPAGSSTLAHKIKISWTAPSTSDGTTAPKDYYVYYQVKGSTTWKKFADPVTTARSATVTGLSSGKYYLFKVVPVNWAGAGSNSAVSAYIKSK